MKLHLVIAVVICMRVAVANSTSEHGQLVTYTARSGTLTIRNLRSDVAPAFAKELEKAIANHVGQHFAYDAKPAMKMEEFEEIMEKAKGLSEDEKFEILGISWGDVDLFRNPAFLNYVRYHRETDGHITFKMMCQNLMKAHGNDIAAVVKTLNVGWTEKDRTKRGLALLVEDSLMDHWDEDLKMSSKEAFETLNLNHIVDESELYVTPAFATWITYVKQLYKGKWYSAICDVLTTEENSKNFRSVVEFAQLKTTKHLTPLAKEWYQKMNYIHDNRYSWSFENLNTV